MKKPETKFKEKVLEDLRLNNFWAEKIQQVVIRGTPDIIACRNGKFIALEMKKDRLSSIDRLQVIKLRKIKKVGGLAYVITPETWPKLLEEIIRLTS